MMVIRYKRWFLGFSAIVVVLSIAAVVFFGLTPGIDFVGGSIFEVRYSGTAPEKTVLEERLSEIEGIGSFTLRETGETGYILRSRTLSDAERQTVEDVFAESDSGYVVERFNTVGPTIGQELRRKAYVAIAVVSLATLLLIAFTFRGVSSGTAGVRETISSWKYGIIALVTLLHDIIVPVGAFAVLGVYRGFEVDSLFVMALLAILGYSVNDTIIVFDRVRENLKKNVDTRTDESFDETVGRSLRETYARSLNTSITTLIVLVALYFIGGETIHNFILTLIIGVVGGAYSSIFLAAPLLTVWNNWTEKKRA